MKMLPPGSVIEALYDAGLLPAGTSKVEIRDDYNTNDPVVIIFTVLATDDHMVAIAKGLTK